MATVNLGRIKPVWKGAWSSSTQYIADDIVSYNNSAWIAVATNTNSAPASNNVNWSLMALGTGIPTQTGNSGKVLTTDGTTVSWGMQKFLGSTFSNFQTLHRASTSWAWSDTPYNISYTTTAANSKLKITFQSNWGQGDTWRGGSIRMLRSANGGSHGFLSIEQGDSGAAGTRHWSYWSGGNGLHTNVNLVTYDAPNVASGTVLNFKLQLATDSRGQPVTLGLHGTNTESSDSTTATGFTRMIVEEYS